MTFTYWGTEHEYADFPYNTTRLNERAVELPIALDFVHRHLPGEGLEVGDVLSNYTPVEWRVVDRYEPGADNLDVFEITGSYDWIVAISTLEHVRWDEQPKNAEGAGDALRHLLSLLKPGGRMLVTIPFGWHPYLDAEILDGKFSPALSCSMIRDLDGWAQVPTEHRRYAATTPWAESVWVAEW